MAYKQILIILAKLPSVKEATSRVDENGSKLLSQVEPEDLIKFGLIPEFIGRLPVIATLEELNESALVEILTRPKNALVKQYQKLFEYDDVILDFEPSALEAVAKEAIKRNTGIFIRIYTKRQSSLGHDHGLTDKQCGQQEDK